ncbi:DegT/DnrJ/EryC1/StrS family aminotransferase [Pseudidiomarina taiwanensis]|uniref:Aminotransferase DegT n=1 Tax=Pseudidiomarina taiwanensis TaxID=337250 RepID=A0A432ZLX1_9GAMM|nr:DegT/DnrJ/EryC1/StrS family aminotransferase [Pseudidiomarina taiwanensis]RUO78412.1 aminotransferase DegT [Pseudidiomarina taiwanensis]
MTIQLFTPNFRVDECLLEIKECLEKGWTGLGFKTNEIEERWKDYSGFEHAHFLSSATAGLHLALDIYKREYHWNDGDEVISSPFTFVSTNHAIKYCNLTPVFADIDEYLCLDPESVRSRITEKTRAVIFVGIGGNVGRYEDIRKLCHEHNLILILDAAHMAGTRLNTKHIGLDADVSVFSFQAVKNLPTADSGMICFKEQKFDSQARILSWLGIDKDTFARSSNQGAYKWRYDVKEVGYKYHGNSIMASLALVGLKYLDQDNGYRRTIANWYTELLENVDGISIVKMAPNSECSQHLFQVRVNNRDMVLEKMNASDIFPGVHYADNTLYDPYRQSSKLCPQARIASDEVVSLPMHMGLVRDDVEYVAQVLIQAVSSEL